MLVGLQFCASCSGRVSAAAESCVTQGCCHCVYGAVHFLSTSPSATRVFHLFVGLGCHSVCIKFSHTAASPSLQDPL